MTDRRPLVVIAGAEQEIPVGDKVPPAALGSGTTDGTKFLRDDGTWAVAGGGGSDEVEAFAWFVS